MKKQILSVFVAFAIFVTACGENDNQGPGPSTGEKGRVQLVISTESAPPLSRAAEAGTSTAEDFELTVDPAQGLSVAVFNEDGSFNSAEQNMALEADGTNQYKTTDFIEVSAGNLFYFVFVNNGDGRITVPSGGDIDDFMDSYLAVTYANNIPDIATSGKFLMGSLWRQETLTAAGGTTAVPTQVTLPSIGRLSSKVTLGAVTLDKTATSPLKGTFSDAEYRVGSVATGINYVGIHLPTAPLWDGTDLPYGANKGVLVTSAKHNAVYGTSQSPNTADFLPNTSFTFEPIDTAAPENTVPFYLTENTTARNTVTGLQYFGNTSYIQVVTKYTPDQSEVIDPATGDPLATTEGTPFAGGTFYTGVVNEVRHIYSTLPNSVAGITDVRTFTDGLNYHKFAIFDTEETDDVMKNRVLRNHLYTFDITGIQDLGAPSFEVNPADPIVSATTVQITVKVANWDKVATGGVVLQ